MKRLGLSFSIGGGVAPSFGQSLGMAGRQVNTLGQRIRALEGEAPYRLGERFSKLTGNMKKTRGEIDRVGRELQGLNAQAEKAGRMSPMLARQIAEKERQLQTLGRTYRRQTSTLKGHVASMRTEGRSVAEVTREYRRLENRVTRLQKRQGMWKNRGRAADAMRSGLSRVNPLAVTAGFAAPVMMAATEEQSEIRLQTALNSDDKKHDMEAAKKTARDFAGTGLASYGEAIDIQYALNSAGLDAGAARAGMDVAGRVAKITGGQSEAVAEVLATSYNNLGAQLRGSNAQKFMRVGELLTKTQLKFQLRNFDQLGESMNKGAGAMATYNVNIAQGATLLGALNSAGRKGSEAGTAFTAVLRQLGKAEDKIGVSRVRDELGQLDMVATLEKIEAGLSGLSLDDRAAVLQDAFGDEGMAAVAPLLETLSTLRVAQDDVTRSSRGLVSSQSKLFEDSKLARLTRIKNRVAELGDSLGDSLFPVIEDGLPAVTNFLQTASRLAESFPGIVRGVGYTAAGLLGLRGVLFVLSPAMKLFSGGLRMLRRGGKLFGKKNPLGGGAVPVEVVNGGAAGAEMGGGFGSRKKTRKAARAGRFFRRGGKLGRIGKLGRFARGGGKLAGKVFRPLGAAVGALTVMDSLNSGEGVGKSVGGLLGGLGGSAGGSALGAAIGTMIFPGIGTAIGGLIGGMSGGALGEWLGGAAGKKLEGVAKAQEATPGKAAKDAVSLSITQDFHIPPGSTPQEVRAIVNEANKTLVQDAMRAFDERERQRERKSLG